MEFPAVADFACTTALVEAAKSIGATTHVGVTASSDTFYPGQERYDTYSGRVVRRFKGSMEEWQAMGVMNYEMESATLLTMCASEVYAQVWWRALSSTVPNKRFRMRKR